MGIQLRELTAAEKAKPYSKYYYRAPVLPATEKLEAMGNPIDPAKALPIEQRNDLLNPGYLEAESGWCILPNGSGYVANYTKMPGVTATMVNWWFAWHGLEDLRYKIWWPQGHFGVALNDKDRKRVLDPYLSLTDKFQGLTHRVVEDAGNGPENIVISFITPEDFGFDMERFTAQSGGTLVAANGISSPVNAPPDVPKAPAVMCHIIRKIPEGIEFRSRFWLGYQILDKTPRLLLPPGIKIPEFVPRGLALHNLFEYTNLASFLPQIYEEQKGVVA